LVLSSLLDRGWYADDRSRLHRIIGSCGLVAKGVSRICRARSSRSPRPTAGSVLGNSVCFQKKGGAGPHPAARRGPPCRRLGAGRRRRHHVGNVNPDGGTKKRRGRSVQRVQNKRQGAQPPIPRWAVGNSVVRLRANPPPKATWRGPGRGVLRHRGQRPRGRGSTHPGASERPCGHMVSFTAPPPQPTWQGGLGCSGGDGWLDPVIPAGSLRDPGGWAGRLAGRGGGMNGFEARGPWGW